MEKWRVMSSTGNSELGKVDIKWGIFEGDSLFPLTSPLVLGLILLILLSLILRKAKAKRRLITF